MFSVLIISILNKFYIKKTVPSWTRASKCVSHDPIMDSSPESPQSTPPLPLRSVRLPVGSDSPQSTPPLPLRRERVDEKEEVINIPGFHLVHPNSRVPQLRGYPCSLCGAQWDPNFDSCGLCSNLARPCCDEYLGFDAAHAPGWTSLAAGGPVFHEPCLRTFLQSRKRVPSSPPTPAH
jgi:hypothetical protein